MYLYCGYAIDLIKITKWGIVAGTYAIVVYMYYVVSAISMTGNNIALLLISLAAGFLMFQKIFCIIVTETQNPLRRITFAWLFSVTIVLYVAFNLGLYDLSVKFISNECSVQPTWSDILTATVRSAGALTGVDGLIQGEAVQWRVILEKLLVSYGAAIILAINALALKEYEKN